ncbi:MBL fold metallo-hydrolase [Cellulosimicrobium arenosum]|uniref:MBL fold metallo-hydrolase n=2 Tax=Cellulosimicrobium arenosum TaxID=2708133 RepID=A0A927G9F3_9MICO|nr:MBL fold metallo-hydrolase [Cellulosimicrobium arenosum]MBD8078780.1 MBL fold metallo-hydrolase [Cellulosimicrobium arenosum]
MTLDGTRSYVLRAPGAAGCVVVDPGPDDDAHLRALAAAGPVELVLVTHRHSDHTAGSARLHALTGAPVRGAEPASCHAGPPLVGGETITASGVRIHALATPGHTADSVCLVLPDDGPPLSAPRAPAAGGGEDAPRRAGHAASGSVLTGDTVLGTGTTVIAEPDGALGAYLASLDAIQDAADRLGGGRPVTGLPGHGPVIDDLAARVRAYREHRLDRLTQVRAALASLGVTAGDPLAVERVTARVYADVDASVLGAARQSVAAQLAFLQRAQQVAVRRPRGRSRGRRTSL